MSEVFFQPVAETGLPLAEAASRLGISERTLRDRIKAGKVRAIKVIGANGVAAYRVFLDTPPPVSEADLPLVEASPQLAEGLVPSVSENAPPPVDLSPLVALLEKVQRENLELAGRVGFYQAENLQLQAQLQTAQARILELEAPKEAPAETTNHPTPEQNGQDSGSRAVSEEPTEQSQAQAFSESTATTTTNGQEASSGGAFKRLWRWLMQPG